jgi:hypothetical protein
MLTFCFLVICTERRNTHYQAQCFPTVPGFQTILLNCLSIFFFQNLSNEWESGYLSQYSAQAGQPRNRGSISGKGKRFFSSPQRPDKLLSPPCLLNNGYLGVKRPEREADQSPQSSAKTMNASRYTSTPYTSSWNGA